MPREPVTWKVGGGKRDVYVDDTLIMSDTARPSRPLTIKEMRDMAKKLRELTKKHGGKVIVRTPSKKKGVRR